MNLIAIYFVGGILAIAAVSVVVFKIIIGERLKKKSTKRMCPRCHTPIENGKAFCSNCGTQIE